LTVGSEVRFSLTFDNPSGDLMILCVAQVVRVQEENGKLGVGAVIVESNLERADAVARRVRLARADVAVPPI
jgi:ABC-type arginine transport system ATPase subunit